MNQTSLDWNENLFDRSVPYAIKADLSIALELTKPIPIQGTQLYEIGQATVPTVKSNQFRLKTILSRLLHHFLKMIVLGQANLRFVVNTKITWWSVGILTPNQRDQIDTLHTPTVFARPLPRDQCHLGCTPVFPLINGSIFCHNILLSGGNRCNSRV